MENLPKILTIEPRDWAESRGNRLTDYDFVELDSRRMLDYFEVINGKNFLQNELEDRTREYALKEGCEVILKYVPMTDPARSPNMGDPDDLGDSIQYHFKATGMRLKR
jgi:hypothetical protein